MFDRLQRIIKWVSLVVSRSPRLPGKPLGFQPHIEILEDRWVPAGLQPGLLLPAPILQAPLAQQQYTSFIDVRVKGPDLRPVSGATVTLMDGQGNILGQQFTNKRGVASFRNRPQGVYQVTASKSGVGTTLTAERGQLAPGQGPWRPTLILSPGLPALVGTSFSHRVNADFFSRFGSRNGPIPVGTNFDIFVTVQNQGAGPAGRFSVKLYASIDSTIDPKRDLFIANLGEVRNLAAGASIPLTSTARLPLNLPPGFVGRVWLGIAVDSENRVAESNEGNNWNGLLFQEQKREVQLYDPIPPRREITGFASEADAIRYLQRQGFNRIILPIFGSGWEKPLSRSLRVRTFYDGAVLPGNAFRQNAFVNPPDGQHSRWWILIQGNERQGEPNPTTVDIFGPGRLRFGWPFYVEDWHSRF